jgi:hypothetical protein
MKEVKKMKEMKEECCGKANFMHHGKHSGGCIYGLGFIGAAVYYISTATGFWMGVLGFFKALVWPAYLVYGLLRSLGL